MEKLERNVEDGVRLLVKTFGYTLTEVYDMDWWEFIRDLDRTKKIHEQSIKDQRKAQRSWQKKE